MLGRTEHSSERMKMNMSVSKVKIKVNTKVLITPRAARLSTNSPEYKLL